MSDVLQRLRQALPSVCCPCRDIRRDAADEIERLRFLLRDVRDRIDAHDWQAHVTSLLSRIDAELNESTKERGEIVNPHVQDHAPEPQPDYDEMQRVIKSGTEKDDEPAGKVVRKGGPYDHLSTKFRL